MTFKVQLVGLSAMINQVDKELGSAVKRLADDLYNTVERRTPVDTGRARKGWSKKVGKDNFVIENKVPYVPILDKGRHMTPRGMRGSKQAPRGIVGPSLTEIKRKN